MRLFYLSEKKIHYAILITALAFFVLFPRAGQTEQLIPGQKDEIPYISSEQAQAIDEAQAEISEQVISAATWFDSFFDDQRYVAEENHTRVKLKLGVGMDRHESFQFKPRIGLRLHLPRLSKKMNILISANDDEDFDVERTPGNFNSRDDDANVTAALQYFLLQSTKMNISSTAGVSLNYAYAGIRYRGKYDYNTWQGRFVSRLRYYTDNGWESRNQYDIERHISDKFLFRTTAEVNWQEKESGLPHALIFSLYQVVKEDKALLYDLGNYFTTSPNYQMTDFVLRLRYRQRFYRDWLVAEIAPQISFPKEYDRQFNPGIIFKLEAEFGYKSYRDQMRQIFSF